MAVAMKVGAAKVGVSDENWRWWVIAVAVDVSAAKAGVNSVKRM